MNKFFISEAEAGKCDVIGGRKIVRQNERTFLTVHNLTPPFEQNPINKNKPGIDVTQVVDFVWGIVDVALKLFPKF